MGASEIGAISAAFYMIEARELLYDLVEAITARGSP
jgi:NADH:ubiquinone oxidoreductase subunit D